MPAILRIDVDKPFLMWGSAPRPGKPCKGLKKSFTKRTCLFYSPGYLEPCKKLIDDLNSRGIKASLFFQPFTVPNKDFAQELMKKGHSIGLHAVHTKDYNDFSRDLGKISRRFGGKVYGFTKHGSGKFKLSRRHDPNYDPNKFIDYAKQSNLRYFLGNRENPDEKEKMANDFKPKGEQRDVFGSGDASERIVKIIGGLR